MEKLILENVLFVLMLGMGTVLISSTILQIAKRSI